MAEDYRLYLLRADGHVQFVHELFCADDDEASEKAEGLGYGAAKELWRRDRLVRRWPAHTNRL